MNRKLGRKTTFATEFLSREAECPNFINADLIAQGDQGNETVSRFCGSKTLSTRIAEAGLLSSSCQSSPRKNSGRLLRCSELTLLNRWRIYIYILYVNVQEAIMNTKLTLRMDDDLIDSAKEHSAKTGKSVSRIVSDLFEIIKNEKLKKEDPLTPTVRALKGALKGKPVDEKDYKQYLEEKYL